MYLARSNQSDTDVRLTESEKNLAFKQAVELFDDAITEFSNLDFSKNTWVEEKKIIGTIEAELNALKQDKRYSMNI